MWLLRRCTCGEKAEKTGKGEHQPVDEGGQWEENGQDQSVKTLRGEDVTVKFTACIQA